MTRTKAWRSIVALAGALWLASLFLSVVEQTELRGYLVLALGWYGVVTGEMGWFANLVFFVGVAQLSSKGTIKSALSLLLAAAILTLAATTLFWDKSFGLETEEAIAGLSFGAGYYAWMAAMLTVSVGLLFRSAANQQVLS